MTAPAAAGWHLADFPHHLTMSASAWWPADPGTFAGEDWPQRLTQACWRALAVVPAEAAAQLGGWFALASLTLERLAPLDAAALLHCGVRVRLQEPAGLRLEAAGFLNERLMATACLSGVFMSSDGGVPAASVPASWRALVAAHLRGKAPVRVHTGPWAELGAEAAPLRHAVFVQEQGVPETEEWDAADAEAVHAVARNGLGQVVATGRLLPAVEGQAKLGRMAVTASLRGLGLGAQVLAALEQVARARGDRAIVLSAQVLAQPFYTRAGYVAEGVPYDEVGIPHIRMIKQLR